MDSSQPMSQPMSQHSLYAGSASASPALGSPMVTFANPGAGDQQRSSAKSNRACEYCRRRKRKCNGDLPACVTCTELRLPCVYLNSKRKGAVEGMGV
jgi:hypothetical protein